ncbi:MAG: AmmeMemoRadiSam system protein B [Candidatus Hydrogenedentes bacterium]|nr:AmmeMemoRadiSam system protein B [Candidatus Hydrogenedentota bacterium]
MGVRYPAVEGQFYPASPASLLAQVSMYIDSAKIEQPKNKVLGIISPHAGYIYSGPTAGYAFARIRGLTVNRVILVGRSHRYLFHGLALADYDSFKTSVGEFPVDNTFYNDIEEIVQAKKYNAPHQYEHCLEVLLPFIYGSLGIVPIVPILLGEEPSLEHYEYGRKIASIANENDLIIASTDLSHYLPESYANKIDKETIEAIKQKNLTDLVEGLATEKYSMCGAPAVLLAMGFSSYFGDYTVTLLDYSTSARTSGDYSSVVGYASISFELSN